MIKAVIFDYGGVISDGGAGNAPSERLARYLDISRDASESYFDGSWGGLMSGTESEDEFWAKVERLHGNTISSEKRAVWNTWDDMRARPQIITLINELKEKGLVVGLLSNVIHHTEALIREHNGYSFFKPCVLSCEFGYFKPDVEIYEELLRQLGGTQPDEIVFIDDQERCLLPAQKLGMRTIHAKNTQQIIDDIKSLLK